MTKAHDTTAWDLAGLTNSDGHLGRPWHAIPLIVPGLIELGPDDTLLWSYGVPPETEPQRIVKLLPPDRSMLNQFVQLSRDDTSAKEICDYARRWGVLGLCEKDWPTLHHPYCVSKAFKRGDTPWYSEPLAKWRLFSRTAQAVVNTAAKLSLEKELTAEEFRAVLTQCGFSNLPSRLQDPSYARQFLAIIVELWLFAGGVRPRLSWDDEGHPYVNMRAEFPCMFGVLGCQLMLAVTNSSGLAVCSGCQQVYTPKRIPARGRNHYCLQCGRTVALRYAARKYRERKRNFRSTNAVLY